MLTINSYLFYHLNTSQIPYFSPSFFLPLYSNCNLGSTDLMQLLPFGFIKNPFSTNAEFESPPPPREGGGFALSCFKRLFYYFFFFCNKLLTGLLTSLNFYSLFFHRATSDLNPKSDHIKSLIKTFQEVPTLLRIKAQILAIAYMDLRHRFPRTILLCVQFLSLVPSISL